MVVGVMNCRNKLEDKSEFFVFNTLVYLIVGGSLYRFGGKNCPKWPFLEIIYKIKRKVKEFQLPSCVF